MVTLQNCLAYSQRPRSAFSGVFSSGLSPFTSVGGIPHSSRQAYRAGGTNDRTQESYMSAGQPDYVLHWHQHVSPSQQSVFFWRNILFRCFDRLLLSEKRLSQPGKSHFNGRSPVCTLLCIVQADPCANSLSQIFMHIHVSYWYSTF